MDSARLAAWPPLPQIVGEFDCPILESRSRQRSGGEGRGEGENSSLAFLFFVLFVVDKSEARD